MIDAHAHAIPAFASTPLMAPAHGALARLVNRVVPSQAVLGIETLATIESALPPRGFALFEEVANLTVLPPALAGGTLDGLLTSMDRHGIDQTILIGARGRISNDWILHEAWPQAPDRLVPVTTMPSVPRDAPVETWVEAYRKLAVAGAAGFKIHPNWDGVLPGHPSYEAAFRIAEEHDRFIIIHTGCFHVRTYREPEPLVLRDLRPYLERHPGARVCLAHMNRRHPEAVWELQRDYEQVWTDTSWQPAREIRRAIKAVGSERIMVGSDWPLLHLGLQRDAIAAAERAASGTDLENILSASARRFIGAAS